MGYNAASDHVEETFFELFSWIPLEISPEVMFDDIKKLPNTDSTQRIGAIAIGAALNLKTEQIDTQVTLPTKWNSIHLAMLGHLILHLPEWALTADAAKVRRPDSETLGEQKPAECAFLTLADWIKFSNVGQRVNRRILSEKFPNLVEPPYNPFVATFATIVLLSFGYTRRMITNILWWVLSNFGLCLGIAFHNSEVLKCTSLALVLGLASIVVLLWFDVDVRLRQKISSN